MMVTTVPPSVVDAPAAPFRRKQLGLAQFIDPEWRHLLHGLIGNPLAVAGSGLILFFVLIALLAPVIAPLIIARQPYMIPRDGFGATPRPPGALWGSRPPPLSFW